MNNEIKQLLEKYPKARERRFKNDALGWIIKEKYGLKIRTDRMADIVGDVLNFDRSWRRCLEIFPELRGKDYNSKDKLEREYQKSLGYNT